MNLFFRITFSIFGVVWLVIGGLVATGAHELSAFAQVMGCASMSLTLFWMASQE